MIRYVIQYIAVMVVNLDCSPSLIAQIGGAFLDFIAELFIVLEPLRFGLIQLNQRKVVICFHAALSFNNSHTAALPAISASNAVGKPPA